ncbi:MAG TPA: AAA family ATPase [Dehalococcoidia bacterium]
MAKRAKLPADANARAKGSADLVRPDEDLPRDRDTASDARLILTCGLPGAGKTTLAAQLAANRGAVRLTKDDWLWALGSTPWDEPAREKVEQELWRLAQEMLRLGLSVVLDFGLWARTERDTMRRVARGLGVGVELHYLDAPIDELWRRIEARNVEIPWNSCPVRRLDFERWLLVFQAPDAAELALFDSPPD